jgi:tetratricopeptide (TPR) repeat protein
MAALAEALGDLPLALEQAAAYMDQTHTTPAGYLALYREHGAELLALREPLATEQTVATTWQVALDQVRATPAAQELLSQCAFLAPDDIPRALPPEHAQVLPEPLRGTIGRPLAYNEAVSALERYSLITATADTLTVHRLVQTVVRASLSPQDQQQWAGAAVRLVAAAFPKGTVEGTVEVTDWPTCTLLLPHALAVADHAETLDVEPQEVALLLNQAAVYLWNRGQYRQALKLLEQALAGFRRVLGDDHPTTLTSMNNLTEVRRQLGEL